VALAVVGVGSPALAAAPTTAKQPTHAASKVQPASKAQPAGKTKTAKAGKKKPPAQASKGPAVIPASLVDMQVINWVISTGDPHGLPFMVIDKVAAKVFLFDDKSQFVGAGPALVGAAFGDDSVPGVGDRELSDIPPSDRTTPAGRFVAGWGAASGGRQVLWVDYSAAISLHPVVTAHPEERRPQRLASKTPEDNRITYGCINVTPAFYNTVHKVFAKKNGIVYILPEDKTFEEVFAGFYAPPVAPPAPRAPELADPPTTDGTTLAKQGER
jgi:hypothetical protein